MISSKIKDLWVRFMQALTMRNYCCFYYLRNIPELILSDKECNKYPNFCDFKVATFLAELEFMQFAWYCGFCKSDHITPVLYDLHLASSRAACPLQSVPSYGNIWCLLYASATLWNDSCDDRLTDSGALFNSRLKKNLLIVIFLGFTVYSFVIV